MLARAGQARRRARGWSRWRASSRCGGYEPADGLFWLYALLPVVVAFVAEQFRIASAQTVLDARGLEDAQAVGRLDDAGPALGRAGHRAPRARRRWRSPPLVVAFLALRAAGTA